MKFLFSSEEQKARVIAKIEMTSPEMAKELYINIMREGEISSEALKIDEPLKVDENIEQIK